MESKPLYRLPRIQCAAVHPHIAPRCWFPQERVSGLASVLIRAIRVSLLLFVPGLALNLFAAEKPLYQNDFETAKPGPPPEDMMVLSGDFSIKQDGTNKFLELPGAPLDTFSVQFGPAATNSVTAAATIRGVGKGRRYPTFGVGVYGVAGYRLQVSPGKNALELYKDQTLLGTVEYEWKSGEWLTMRLLAEQLTEGRWKLTGKVWLKGTPEPATALIQAEDRPEQPPSGRASVFGSPFSVTPIQFDDLLVE